MAHYDGRGFKIHYVQEGKGPAVIFAHGFCMDHTMFAAQFEDLPDSGNHCVAWDMRGHGNSECPPGPWSMQDSVVDMIRFIEGINGAPCHLVGMSWGGMIALRVAIQREDLLRSVTLIDTDADAETPSNIEAYHGYMQQVAAEDGVSEELARGTAPLFYGPSYMEREPEAIEIHVRRMMEMPATAVVEGLRALTTRNSVVERLGGIRLPTLVIHGEVDAAIPIARAEVMADTITGAEFVRIPDAGHTTPMESPDIVNQALAEFVDRVG